MGTFMSLNCLRIYLYGKRIKIRMFTKHIATNIVCFCSSVQNERNIEDIEHGGPIIWTSFTINVAHRPLTSVSYKYEYFLRSYFYGCGDRF